jgi:hypothetical protein
MWLFQGLRMSAHVPALVFAPGKAHSASMYEARNGDYTYSIRRHTFRSGKTVWAWEVRHWSGPYLDSGISLLSLDAAKSAALEAISLAPTGYVELSPFRPH